MHPQDSLYVYVIIESSTFCVEYLPFREVDIIKNHVGCNYVSDTRTGFENHPDDTKWVAGAFMPTAAEYGCKIIYFIINENNSLKEEREDQEGDSSDII